MSGRNEEMTMATMFNTRLRREEDKTDEQSDGLLRLAEDKVNSKAEAVMRLRIRSNPKLRLS
jgi:hypothetical protein